MRNGGRNRELEAARLAEAALDEMMTDAEAVYDSSAAAELETVSSITALNELAYAGLEKQNSAVSVTTSLDIKAHRVAAGSAPAEQWQEMLVC